jgi:hypothetical protein
VRKEITDRLPRHRGILTMYPLSVPELDGKSNNIVDDLINSAVVKNSNKGVSRPDLYEKLQRRLFLGPKQN